jgi:hypothetical protein
VVQAQSLRVCHDSQCFYSLSPLLPIHVAKEKSQTSLSPFARPEILSFLGVWLHRSRNEIEMSNKDICTMVSLRLLEKGKTNHKHVLNN